MESTHWEIPYTVTCCRAWCGSNDLPYGAVGLAHLFEWRMSAGIIGTRGPVAHDRHYICYGYISELLEVTGHVLAPVDANWR